MPASTRRALLGAVGVAVCGSLAGCGAFDSPSKLSHLRVANTDAREHTVHVLLFEGDSLAHWASQRVPAADGEELGAATFEGYPTELEPTRLLARLDGQPMSAATRFDFTAHDADCLGLRLEIGDQRPDPDLVVWYTSGPAPCENETATPTE